MTNNPGSRESSVIRLSAMPSAKYSCVASPLRLANGSTASDGLSSIEGWMGGRGAIGSRLGTAPSLHVETSPFVGSRRAPNSSLSAARNARDRYSLRHRSIRATLRATGWPDADDGVDRGIEALIAVEYLNADGVTLQAVGVSSECFRDDDMEEAPESLRLHERRTDERLGQPVGADHGKPALWIPAPICR